MIFSDPQRRLQLTAASRQNRPFHSRHYANRFTGRLSSLFLKTQRSYRLSDLDRLFLVGISAPTGMTDLNMLDVMPRAFTCSTIPQRDHLPSLKFKASYLVERAPDGGL